jgi:Tfp pilus assembly protein PilF
MAKVLKSVVVSLLACAVAGCGGAMSMDAGQRLEGGGDYNGALQQYKQAHEEKPHSAAPLMGIARCQKGLGDAKASEQAYRDAVKADPTNPEGMVALANALLERKDFVEAKVQLDEAYNHDSKYVPAIMGQAKMCDMQNDNDGAVLKYKEAVALDPNNLELRNTYVHALGLANKWDDVKREQAEIDRIKLSSAKKQ